MLVLQCKYLKQQISLLSALIPIILLNTSLLGIQFSLPNFQITLANTSLTISKLPQYSSKLRVTIMSV